MAIISFPSRYLLLQINRTRGRNDTQTADYQPVVEKLRADTETYQDRMVRYRFAMKGKMTREEWAKAFPAEEPKPAQK